MITHCSAFNSHTQYWTKCETDTLVTLNIHSFEMRCHLIATKALCLWLFYSSLRWGSYYDAKTKTLKWYRTVKKRAIIKNLMRTLWKVGHIKRTENDLCVLTKKWDSYSLSKIVLLAIWQVPNNEHGQIHIKSLTSLFYSKQKGMYD